MTLANRFAAKYAVVNSCWIWTGAVGRDGYGHIVVMGRVVGAHRVAYELHVGPIPKGCELHHACQTPRCVNPDHLVPVTRKEHRALEWKPRCQRGHERRRAPSGRWTCPTCQADASRRYYRKRVAA